jgi:DNA-binding transcriptional MerR regulator
LARVKDASGAGTERYTTGELAAVAGCSVQQIRDLERLGVIPPAERQSNGYRRFTAVHLTALRAYRGLVTAVGPSRLER